MFEFPISMPAQGSGQLAQSLYGQLRDAILDGRLSPGQKLPTTRTVAAAYSVSRNTAKAAYELLHAEGYVLSKERSGTYVSKNTARPLSPQAATGSHGDDAGYGARLLVDKWNPAALSMRFIPPAPCRYDFSVGIPDLKAFPFEIWRKLATRSMRIFERNPTAYDESQGRAGLRAAIANHISFTRAVYCEADDLQVTSGAQQAFDLLARILVVPEVTAVAVENPGYTSARNVFRAAGARIVPIAVDDEGMMVEQIPTDVKIIVVTPSHQFPLGMPMSLQRRSTLLEFARRHGAVIIEDDYDSEFRFGGRPLDALRTMDRHDSVFYVGTFSKSVFPSIRIGYVVAPRWARASLTAAKRDLDWHCEPTVQDTLAAFITEGHMARHIRKMRALYEERRNLLMAALKTELSDWLSPLPSCAGLHMSAYLRPDLDAEQLVKAARERDVGVLNLAAYSVGEVIRPGLVFGYGAADAKVLRTGLLELVKVCELLSKRTA